MKNLPLGIQTFSDIITQNYLYVDKTRDIHNLFARGGKYYFLSRPRRFGKSLLISTLNELFSGNKELFKGLWIYDKTDWKTYPVIHIDFSEIDFETVASFKKSLQETIERIGNEYGIELTSTSYKTRFAELIRKLSISRNNKVVVLVDEYDKPIISFIETEEKRKAGAKKIRLISVPGKLQIKNKIGMCRILPNFLKKRARESKTLSYRQCPVELSPMSHRVIANVSSSYRQCLSELSSMSQRVIANVSASYRQCLI